LSEPYPYGTTEPIPFKITLNGVGITGLTLVNADLALSKDQGAFANIGLEVTEIDKGWYYWTPSDVAQTQAKTLIINLKDTVNSGVFDENAMVIRTGGNASAFYPGTR